MATILVTLRTIDTGPRGPLAALLDAGHELRHVPCPPNVPAGELARHLAGCEAVIAGSEPYAAEVFDGAPALRHVARFGAGYDAIDLAAATERGVIVTTAPGANADAVADMTLGLILAAARAIPRHDHNVRQGVWQSAVGADVWQQTLGIVGLGRIGQGVARRAGGFDMRILAYEPYPNAEFVRQHGIELVPLERVFAEADFVTIHVPAMAETDRLVDARLLGLMKPTAFFINAARGRIVDEDALYAVLSEHRIAGAALDVREVEPPADTRFNTLDNVVLTPHTAASTVNARIVTGRMTAAAVLQAVAGEQPAGLMNPEAWDRFMGRH